MDKKYNYMGMGFWLGGFIYSLINMIMNYKGAEQSAILNYNYLIAGVAVFGFILNAYLLKKKVKRKK